MSKCSGSGPTTPTPRDWDAVQRTVEATRVRPWPVVDSEVMTSPKLTDLTVAVLRAAATSSVLPEKECVELVRRATEGLLAGIRELARTYGVPYVEVRSPVTGKLLVYGPEGLAAGASNGWSTDGGDVTRTAFHPVGELRYAPGSTADRPLLLAIMAGLVQPPPTGAGVARPPNARLLTMRVAVLPETVAAAAVRLRLLMDKKYSKVDKPSDRSLLVETDFLDLGRLAEEVVYALQTVLRYTPTSGSWRRAVSNALQRLLDVVSEDLPDTLEVGDVPCLGGTVKRLTKAKDGAAGWLVKLSGTQLIPHVDPVEGEATFFLGEESVARAAEAMRLLLSGVTPGDHKAWKSKRPKGWPAGSVAGQRPAPGFDQGGVELPDVAEPAAFVLEQLLRASLDPKQNPFDSKLDRAHLSRLSRRVVDDAIPAGVRFRFPNKDKDKGWAVPYVVLEGSFHRELHPMLRAELVLQREFKINQGGKATTVTQEATFEACARGCIEYDDIKEALGLAMGVRKETFK